MRALLALSLVLGGRTPKAGAARTCPTTSASSACGLRTRPSCVLPCSLQLAPLRAALTARAFAAQIHNNLGGKGGPHNDETNQPEEIRYANLMRIDEDPAEAFSRTLRVSCERMYEAYGASFVTADYVDGGAQPYTFDWASQCGCTTANPSPCFGNIIDVKAAWLAYPTNPTFAPAPTMVDAVLEATTEYVPKNTAKNGFTTGNMLAQVNVAVKGYPWTQGVSSTWGGAFDMTLTFRPSCCVPNPDVEDDRCSRFIAAPFDAAEASKLAGKVDCYAVEGLPDRHRVCDMKVEPLTKDDRDVRVALQKCPAMDSDIKFKSTVVKLTAYDFDKDAKDNAFNPGGKEKSREIFTFYNYLEYQYVQPVYDMSAVQGWNTPWSKKASRTRGDDSLCPPATARTLDRRQAARLVQRVLAGMNGKCEGFKLSKLIGEYVDATNAEVAIDETNTGRAAPTSTTT